jgi:hypothetical protein
MADWAIFNASGKLIGQCVMPDGETPARKHVGRAFATVVLIARQADPLTEDVDSVTGQITVRAADRDRIVRHDRFARMTRGELIEFIEALVDEKVAAAIAAAGIGARGT